MNIVTIIAGTNSPSNSAMLAEKFVAGMTGAGAEVQAFHLKDLRIEQFTLDHYKVPADRNDDYYQIEDAIKSANALVIASPVWNFSVPGHLKNFIDRLGAFGLNQETHSLGTLKGMPVYFIFTGGTPLPVWTSMLSITSSHMGESLRYFGASIVGTHFEGRCTPGRGVFGLVVDQRPDSLALLEKKGADFAKIVSDFIATGKLPLRNQLSYKIFKFGYAVVNKLVYALG